MSTVTSMAVADHGLELDVLTLFSYPLHPPGKPEKARTEHLPRIAVPTIAQPSSSSAASTARTGTSSAFDFKS